MVCGVRQTQVEWFVGSDRHRWNMVCRVKTDTGRTWFAGSDRHRWYMVCRVRHRWSVVCRVRQTHVERGLHDQTETGTVLMA